MSNFQKTGDVRDDPYSVLSAAQKQGIVVNPADAPLLRAEHNRLQAAARDAYGTPEYNDRAQQSVDFANATKQVVHGPASELMTGLQEPDVPRYNSPADFDAIVRERMGHESTPEQKATFEKAADEVKNGENEVSKSADEAQQRLKKYQPKDEMKFEDAVDSVRTQIANLVRDCVL